VGKDYPLYIFLFKQVCFYNLFIVTRSGTTIMVSVYVDENKTIYAYQSLKQTNIPTGSSANVTLGLADMTDLSGQSTIIINKIHFGVTAFLDSATPADQMGSCLVLGGITPEGYISPSGGVSNLANLSDYQEIKGWPLKGVSKFLASMPTNVVDQNGLVRSSFTKSFTTTRGNSLALNRGHRS
jgi:hypothetical protein